MAFIRKQGYLYSENGWRMCDINECDTMEVPNSGIRLPFRKGAANDIMRGWLSWFNTNVESLNNPGRGYTDEGSYTGTNSVGNSNHNSATAADLNWSEHAFRVSYSGFNQQEIARCREGLRLFTYKGKQMIWWGQDWASPKDAMHFQLNCPESDSRNREFADLLLGGYLNIFKKGGPIVIAPPIPVGLPGNMPGWINLEYGSHGPLVQVLQNQMSVVFSGYRGMPLVVDGDFGPSTESAVKEFQFRTGLEVDGVVGPNTRKELAKYGVAL